MGSDFLVVAADRADKHRNNTYLCPRPPPPPLLNYHADSFCCVRTSLNTTWTWAEPLTPCLAGLHCGLVQASAPLQRQSWRSHSWWAVLSFFRTSSLVPIYFQPVVFLPQAEQIVLFPRCKAVPSSSPCFLSSTGAWIPSSQRQDVATCPAFSSATWELLRKHSASVYSRGFWARVDSAITLSFLTRVRCCLLCDQRYPD